MIRGDETRIEKNRVEASGEEGIDLNGIDNQIVRNVVKSPAGSGIDLGDDNAP